MKHLVRILLIGLLIANIPATLGIASIENETVESTNSFLVNGKTTQQEVQEKFGKPTSVNMTTSVEPVKTNWI